MEYNLEPIDPRTAVEMYLLEREPEVSKATLYAHKSRLGHFIRWCDENNVDNLNELTGRKLYEYRVWRQDEGNLAKPTLKTQMATLRVFIRWCENIDAVIPDLSIKVQSPTLTAEERARDVMLDSDRATQVLAYLEKYEYASLPHVTIALLWHTMMRRGSAHALDVSDYDPKEKTLEVHHRPDTGTPIKNKSEGERIIALSDSICELLDDWIARRRPNVVDKYDREPLLATNQGRIHTGTIQGYVYYYTSPCVYSGECPHGRDAETCEAMKSHKHSSKCPSSVSPHAIRRGGITHWLKRDVPSRVVSDRANVSQDVLDRHYDRRSEREKTEQRRKYLDNI